MGNYKRCSVVFNLDNGSHKELYDWCMAQSTNFSDYVRTLLFLHRQRLEDRGIKDIDEQESVKSTRSTLVIDKKVDTGKKPVSTNMEEGIVFTSGESSVLNLRTVKTNSKRGSVGLMSDLL